MSSRRWPALLALACLPALATTPPRPGETQRFPPFTLDGPGEHVLFSSMLVTTGPFFFSAVTSESSSDGGAQKQQVREDAAAFIASDGAYRTATLEAQLRQRRAGSMATLRHDLDLASELLVGGHR